MINAVLKVIGGKQDGKLIPLTTKKFLIGREQDCHLRPNSDSVSRHHCVITLDDFSVQVRDLGSSNGTFLNNVRVLGIQQAKSGDRLKIGTLEFEVVSNAKALVGAAAGASDVKSSGTSFSLDEFGLEEVAPSQETAVVSSKTEDTVVVSPAQPSDASQSAPVVGDDLNLDAHLSDDVEPATEGAETVVETPLDATAYEVAPTMPGYDAAAMGMGMPQGMPPGMPGMGYPGYAQPQGYPGYGMQMPQPGYPYGMPQQPYPGYGMPMAQPGYGMPMYGGMPGAMPQGMPYGQPGYPQPMGYGAYPQAMPQAMPQVAPQPEAAPEVPKGLPDALPVKLPPPEETGAKAPVIDPNKPAEAPKAPAPNPAADVLKKYMNRR